ncbi:MAG: HlyD family efflux transporter periplasmic adaptor subunit [Alcanivoracaceae bacterium]|jgi:HlyD family secretion protein|nr:HlyD family efflux transporter periplasmic adaptor subunit [Alcanivoracaceae bacterium]
MAESNWKSARGRMVFWGMAALLALLVLFMTLRPQPVWVDAVAVSRQALTVTIIEEGHTRVKDRYVVSAPVAGYLRRIELQVGDRVMPQQLLTQLEPLKSTVLDARSRAEARAHVAASRASLAAAEEQVAAAAADHDLAQSDLARLQKLAADQLVSAETLQKAEAAVQRSSANLRSARFGVDVARHELAAAQTRLDVSAASGGDGGTELVAIRSPIAGAVLQRLRQSEGVVSPGQPLLELGDPTALEVVVDVQSFDAVRIKPGMPVELAGWGGDRLAAVVRTVEPVGFTDVSALGVEEQRVRVVVDISAPREAWQSLGDGYRVDAHFILWQQPDVLVMPASAVFEEDGQAMVFVIADGVVSRRAVTTGRSDGFLVQVTDGLQAGEQVVRHPDNALSDGARVRTNL